MTSATCHRGARRARALQFFAAYFKWYAIMMRPESLQQYDKNLAVPEPRLLSRPPLVLLGDEAGGRRLAGTAAAGAAASKEDASSQQGCQQQIRPHRHAKHCGNRSREQNAVKSVRLANVTLGTASSVAAAVGACKNTTVSTRVSACSLAVSICRQRHEGLRAETRKSRPSTR